MNTDLAFVATSLGLPPPCANVACAGVSTDSRQLLPGNLFIALRGPHFDGHQFIEQARTAGAAAALVEHRQESALPQLIVPATLAALGELAAAWRARFALPVVAVTGSNGKTTVKEMLAAIFGGRASVLATRGNLNNAIGVPLTLLRLDTEHRHAVIEMGANHPGEIAYVTRIAQPTVALITNAGAAHLEGFGDVSGVARAKGEIYSGLVEDGIAVINADDNFAPLWHTLAAGRRRMTFGLHAAADVSVDAQALHTRARNGRVETQFQLLTKDYGAVDVCLPLAGRHNVMNALAAAVAALAVGMTPEDIAAGLSTLTPVAGRLQPQHGLRGALLIDDTYNANPDSLQAALDWLATCPSPRWLVLGDMGELGMEEEALHRRAGQAARAVGIARLFTCGNLSRAAAAAFGSGAEHFDTITELSAAVREQLHQDVTVLVKGSRFMRMEQAVQALSADVAAAGSGCGAVAH